MPILKSNDIKLAYEIEGSGPPLVLIAGPCVIESEAQTLRVAEGLATCPQAALGEYPGIVRKTLDYPEDHVLVCGMALGYEDTAHPINQYRTPRDGVEAFTRWYS